MTEESTFVCDCCGAWCKWPDGEWTRSIKYIRVQEYSKTTGGKKEKYHLCYDIKEPDGAEACVPEDFQNQDDGYEMQVTWAYNRDQERISGARWTESPGKYSTYVDSFEEEREDFPDYIEEMAQTIEEKVYG